MAKKGELTARQKRMIAALLTSKNIGEACESVGVGRTTLTRWLANEAFNNALKQAQGDAINRAGYQLIAAQEKSIQILVDLAESANNESVKRAAANDLLNHSLKFDDRAGLETRIQALEKAINGNTEEQ